MYKIGIVSCDKWINKIVEDNLLKNELINRGMDADIISWQQPLKSDYDILILRSVWGYQNEYEQFKKWLMSLKKENVKIVNDVDLIVNNIDKYKQFQILKNNNVSVVNTVFLEEIQRNEMTLDNISEIDSDLCVIKPSISGSGDNTYVFSKRNSLIEIPNSINTKEIYEKMHHLLEINNDCKIMVQPFVPEINNGEYSCIFIEGSLSHTMLRFPNIFHEKRKTYLVNNPPIEILNLAYAVEKISEFSGYLYMRVDIIIQDNVQKIMEVELAEPDLLTKYVDDDIIQKQIIKSLSTGIERRIIK